MDDDIERTVDHYEQRRREFEEAVLPEKYLRAMRDYRKD